ncbi:hypothetical protein DFH08DRAFT_317959 [Mycena albidolilacea]|uniref:Uncharacterized protein n=1 Tax=Mycena albidolilacea TaxID=1033008 RepID=A0AAD7EKJ4_9AGAR|nr:hypothetical protein DFH08DRAFT_317959 [Mycena albidolilacea]
MSNKVDILKARLVLAKASQENTSKRSKKQEKENQDVQARGGKRGGKKDTTKDAKSTRNPPAVKWSEKEFHPMTDELLTVIESKPRYRQAFGFDKGIQGPVDTGGKKLPAIQADVAEDLFIKDKPDTEYTADDLSELAKVIKNRVTSLKTAYGKWRKKLGETGHSLVAADKEDDIKSDSVIANAWDLIQEKFPWYKRMNDLMGSSPVIDRSAVAHSGTRINLRILDRDGEAHNGLITLDSDDESKLSNWDTFSPAPIPDDDDNSGDENLPATPVVKVKAEARAPPLSSARGVKRKSMHDHIQDLTTQNHTKQIKLTEVKERERTARAKAKYDAKNHLEMARLEHQEREAERQCVHELQLLERRIQFEAMRRNAPTPVRAMEMYDPGAPAYGAPPPNFVVDPALM